MKNRTRQCQQFEEKALMDSPSDELASNASAWSLRVCRWGLLSAGIPWLVIGIGVLADHEHPAMSLFRILIVMPLIALFISAHFVWQLRGRYRGADALHWQRGLIGLSAAVASLLFYAWIEGFVQL